MAQNGASENRTAASCQLVSFDHAEIRKTDRGGPLLVVSGTAPSTHMDVFLSHRCYGETPEWWGIEVVGSLPGGVCLTETRHFETAMPVSEITGLRGIEVIGADGTLRLEVETTAALD